MAPASAFESNTKLITCILPKGSGRAVVEALHNRGVITSNLYYARGSDYGDPPGKSGMPEPVEKEFVTVVVPPKDADELFRFIHETAQIDRPGGGILYQTSLRKSVPFVLPDLATSA